MTPQMWVDLLLWPGIVMGAALGFWLAEKLEDFSSRRSCRHFRMEASDFVVYDRTRMTDKEFHQRPFFIAKGMVSSDIGDDDK